MILQGESGLESAGPAQGPSAAVASGLPDCPTGGNASSRPPARASAPADLPGLLHGVGQRFMGTGERHQGGCRVSVVQKPTVRF